MSMAQGVFFKEAIKLVDIYSALFANLTSASCSPAVLVHCEC